MKNFDVIVIGGGGAGLTASKLLRGFGKSVALVDKRERLGGECTWTGCVPSKTLIKAASVAHTITHANQYGVSHTSNTFNTSNVMTHVRSVVQEVYKTHTPDLLEQLGIAVFFGDTQFVDAHTLRVGSVTLQAKKFIIATGSFPNVPSIEGLSDVDYLTNENLFDLEKLPQSMVILGGGPIGSEMASALNRLGVKITIVEMQECILMHEDVECATVVMEAMRTEGVEIQTSMRATQVTQSDGIVTVHCIDSNNKQHTFSAEKLLVAVGRKPNLDFNPKAAGITVTKKGITVNRALRTSAKHIYACGDVVGPYQFSHMAWYQAVTAGYNAVVPLFKRKIDYTDKVWVTFTAPELAYSGLTEAQAREQYGDSIRVYKKSYAELDRAMTDGATVGFAKYICDKKGRLLGIHVVGERAGEVMQIAHLAKAKGIRLSELQSVMHAYPTYAELGWHAAKKAYLDKLDENFFVQIFKRFFL